MSFILDALKRSERERANAPPGAPPAPGPEPRGPRLTAARIVIPILLVGAALGGFWWWGQGGTKETPPAPVAVTPPVTETDSVVAPKASAPPDPTGVSRGAELQTAAPAPIPAPAFAVPPAPPPKTVVLDPRVVPFISQLPEDFQRALPPMIVNIHVYVPDESARLLFINNRQVQKGEWLSGAVRLDEIVPEGAVMTYQGVRFKLPRPR